MKTISKTFLIVQIDYLRKNLHNKETERNMNQKPLETLWFYCSKNFLPFWTTFKNSLTCKIKVFKCSCWDVLQMNKKLCKRGFFMNKSLQSLRVFEKDVKKILLNIWVIKLYGHCPIMGTKSYTMALKILRNLPKSSARSTNQLFSTLNVC